jgi:surfeit locus 1 family protein
MPMDPRRAAEQPRLRWHWNGKLVAFCVVLLPITVAAGFWQLGRAEEKRHARAVHQQRENAVPVDLVAIDVAADQQFRTVVVSGWPDQQHQFLVDNRMRNGRAGYEVLLPLRFGPDQWILVNRGWLPREQRGSIPALPETRLRLAGHLYRATRLAPVLGPEEVVEGWPQVIQQPTPELLEQRLGRELFPYQLRLDESPGLETGWVMSGLTVQQHLGYAVQWFALSAALLILGAIGNSTLPEWWRVRRRRSHE